MRESLLKSRTWERTKKKIYNQQNWESLLVSFSNSSYQTANKTWHYFYWYKPAKSPTPQWHQTYSPQFLPYNYVLPEYVFLGFQLGQTICGIDCTYEAFPPLMNESRSGVSKPTGTSKTAPCYIFCRVNKPLRMDCWSPLKTLNHHEFVCYPC